MSTGGALNLSLLSRGVGEVSKNGHEKVDVIFEPQDYFNFVDSRRYYLPPIHSHVTFNTSHDISARSSGRPVQEIYLPKTFTTRKGALLLFSEDLAHRTRQADVKRQSHHKGSEQEGTDISENPEDLDIKTVEDLTKSILSYGRQGKEREESDIYLKFVHSRRRDYFDRQIRPGFSAKRYLSTWTKSWDDSVLEKVISKGYLTEKSLFYYNPLLPHLSRRLNDDMSHYPAPYKLMRSMLMSPGSLSGYTFYRVRPESAETVEIAVEDGRATRVSIKVLSTKDGVQKEVTYASLDRKGQEEVLTDLLVKSAVHYAIKKQQEYMEEYMDVGGQTQVPIPEFDMKNAVESLLETEQYVAPHGTAILEPDFPEMDSRSQSSTYSGSFKGTRVKRKYSSHEKQEKVYSKAAQADRDEREDGDYDMRSSFTSNIPQQPPVPHGPSFTSNIPQLPPVPHGPNLVLTPIGEASREHTQALSLPPVIRNGKDGEKIPAVNVQPPTPQHSILSNLPTSRGMPRDGNLATTPEMKEEDDEDERWSVAVQEREYQQQLRRQREQDERRERKAKHRAKVSQQNIEYDAVSAEGKGMLPSGGSQLLSSSESLVGGSSQSTSSKALPRPQGWKGSTQSLRSYGSRKGQDSRTAVTVSPHQSRTSSALEKSPGSTAEEGSLRGSIIFGPDGEAILIGGKIAPTHKHHDPLHISEVHYANKYHTRDTSDESDAEVPDEWRTRQRIQSEKLSENLKKYAHKRDEEEMEVTPVENHRSEHGSSQPVSIASSVLESPKSSVTEKEIVDALTEHAQKIAENILSSQDAGQNLEKDIRRAAELWMETHPVRHISRSQSVQEVANRTMIEEIMKNQKRNSAGPTVAEYRDEIKKNLVTAITKAAGMEAGSIPLDAEIDPELMQALANQTLTPEDIEIIRDENGRSIIRSRTRMHQAMGGVKEGHIYMPATQANADQRKISIPADRASIMDVGQPDVIHYGEKPIHETASEIALSEKSPSERHPSPRTVSDKVSEKAQSLKGKSPAQSLKGQSQAVSGSLQGDVSSRVSGATKSQVSFQGVESPGDDLAKALADMEAAGSLSKEGAASLKSSKSGASLKSSEEKSKVSDKSSKKEEKKEEFVVGLYDHMEENKKLYGMPTMVDKSTGTETPGRVDHTEENKRIYGVKSRKGKPKEKAKASAVKKPEVKKGGKKGKGKKKEKEVEEPPLKEPSPEVLESTPLPPKALTPKEQTSKSETPIVPEREETPVTVKSEEEEEEDFIIVRDESYSPEPVVEPLQRVPSVTSHTSEEDDSKSDQDLKMISNREARNAKRAAAAEKRRQEVERKRREREEQLKREKEEQERQEKMKQELEELRRKKEEERRLKKLQEDEEAEREAREANELELRRQRELEREKRKKEEYAKKLEEMRKKQAEEEQRKAEEAERRRLEEEEERKREAEMLAAMEEEERIEYERCKQLEEEERQKREAEEKRRREEEAQRAMELARKLAEEMARKQAELEARLRFNRSVQVESSGLDHTQDITRAFVFSYFELLQWLGLDIPEFELLKLNQY